MAVLLVRLIDFYTLVVFAAVLLSWVPAWRDNAIARFIESATEPVLERIRRVLPPMGGLDLSPMLLLVGLQMIKRLLR
jgi:YggT family protein